MMYRETERVARIDDYRESFRLASEALKKANLHRLAKLAGADIVLGDNGSVHISLEFLAAPYVITVAEAVEVQRDGADAEVPLPEKILLCHYLLHASGEPPSGELITFRQIPDGHFYFDAFQRRARDPFLAAFGRNPDLFRACAQTLGGQPMETGDVAMQFRVLPGIWIGLVLWRGDEEFPPEASILFEDNIHHNLEVEDIAVLSGMLVYRLMAIARTRQAQAEK